MISKINPHRPNLNKYNQFIKEQARHFEGKYEKEYLAFRQEYGLKTDKRL
jgi:hypothetical protein